MSLYRIATPGQVSKGKVRSRFSPRYLVFLTVLAVTALTVLPTYLIFRKHSGDKLKPTTASLPSDSTDQTLFSSGGLSLPTPHITESHGPVYPYSVIPGGVYSTQELKQARSQDVVVAAHFSDFALHKAKIVQSKADNAVYVSYRIHNDIFWTKRKLRLAQGEMLITDGVSYARTRCGNRISETPRAKTSPHEPSVEVLETPSTPGRGIPREAVPTPISIAPELELINFASPLPSPPGAGPEGGILNPPPPASEGGFGLPPIPPILLQNSAGQLPPPPGGGSGGGVILTPPPPLPENGGKTPLPPGPPVPEPGTLMLFSSGLAGAYLCLRRRSKHRG